MMNSNSSSKNQVLVHSCLAAVIACLLAVAWSYYSNIGSGSNNNEHNPNHSKDVIHAISGAVGSALSITLLYPLETIRTRLQLQVNGNDGTSTAPLSSLVLVYKIGKSEGIRRGLYKGWYSLVVTLMILNFVYFYCFRGFRRWIEIVPMLEGNKVVVDLASGYLAGVIAVLITGPLWLVNMRLKLQGVSIGQSVSNKNGKSKEDTSKSQNRYTGIIHCLYRISKEEGILTLWHGTFTSIILALNPAIQLGVYEMLKRHHFIISSSSGSSSLEPFTNALIAKFIATIITYPIQVLQTRHRAGVNNDKEKETGESMKSSFVSILLRLYRGLESKLLQTCLNSALMFVAYERLVDMLTALLMLEE